MILIVDDLPDNACALRRLLQHEGYYVECVTCGEAALSIVRTIKPGLIIMDANMPGETGIEVMQDIRRNPDMQTVPVLFYSASLDQTLMDRAKTAGAVGWVIKGFHSWDYLREKIQRIYPANATAIQ